jgi:superoxide dismutase, Cu-Zn family
MFRHLLCIPLLLAAGLASGQTPARATATLKNAQGAEVGTATITPIQPAGGVSIKATLTKLPAGTHAFHIHTTGTCTPPDFTSAGGHFNPGGKQHGKDNPNGHHAGDLPNFEADAKGEGHISYTVPDVTLDDGPNSLFHAGGTALVIHGAADDNKTDPAGNAGPRIACGVIEKAKS